MSRLRPLALAVALFGVSSLAVAGQGLASTGEEAVDSTPPELVDVSLSSSSVDVRPGGQQLDLRVEARDDGVGTASVVVVFGAADGSTGGVNPPQMTLTEGTAHSGTYTGTVTVPQYTVPGVWRIGIRVHDWDSNRTAVDAEALEARGLPSGFTVTSDEDSEPPALVSFALLPDDIDVRDAAQVLEARVHVRDDRSGVDPGDGRYPTRVVFSLQSPVTRDYRETTLTLSEGTLNDGVFTGRVTLERNAEDGGWQTRLYLHDRVGNVRQLLGDPVSSDSGLVTMWLEDGRRTAPPADYVDASRDGSMGAVVVAADGTIYAKDALNETVVPNASGGRHPVGDVVGATRAPEGQVWAATDQGDVLPFNTAKMYGSAIGVALNKPIVAISARPTGAGYWIAAADGGVFSYGDAPFLGSAGDLQLQQPIIGLASNPRGDGYWLAASDGGVFTFGNAHFAGSTGNERLTTPIVDIAATPTGNGYWLATASGRVYAFGDAEDHGSLNATASTVVALSPTPTGNGYWILQRDGALMAFGDAVPLDRFNLVAIDLLTISA